MFDGELPDELVGKKDYVFANYADIHAFHDQWVEISTRSLLVYTGAT